MPTFKTQPSRNLGAAIRNLIASGGGKLGPLQEMQADQAAAETAQKLSLAQKARAEVEAMQAGAARRADPALRTEYAAHSAGIDLPDATRLSGAIRGELEQPGPGDIDDANAAGVEARPYPMARPNLGAGKERLFRAALASVGGLDFATGETNAKQLAEAAGEHHTNAITQAVQEAIARGDVQGASAMSQGSKPGTAIKLFDNVGDTGATFAPATGTVNADSKAQPGNTLLASTIAKIAAEEAQRRGAATASTAAAQASRAHAGLYTAQTDNERTGRARTPPPGYRWGPAGADGQPTLVKIPGGPAEDKATSSDAERISAGYAERMDKSGKIVDQLEKSGVGKPGWLESMYRAAGAETAANVSQQFDPERQKYRQAQEDWVRAKLRKESGAVIAADEMDREIRVYFPQIGDGADVIAQKATSRKVAEKAMRQAAGRAAPQGGSGDAPAGTVEVRKKIGNVEFVKINGQWYQP